MVEPLLSLYFVTGLGSILGRVVSFVGFRLSMTDSGVGAPPMVFASSLYRVVVMFVGLVGSQVWLAVIVLYTIIGYVPR